MKLLALVSGSLGLLIVPLFSFVEASRVSKGRKMLLARIFLLISGALLSFAFLSLSSVAIEKMADGQVFLGLFVLFVCLMPAFYSIGMLFCGLLFPGAYSYCWLRYMLSTLSDHNG